MLCTVYSTIRAFTNELTSAASHVSTVMYRCMVIGARVTLNN